MPEEMREELHKLREAGGLPEQLGDLRAELELVQTEAFGEPQKEMPVPRYFSTECCSYGDGDVTGLELSDGEIRPVRQLNDDYQPKKKLLSVPPRKLRDVFAQVAAAQP